jgi:hypothetical protein
MKADAMKADAMKADAMKADAVSRAMKRAPQWRRIRR